MIVKQMHDGTFTIIGLSYAALEDLVSAYDFLSFSFPPGDLYSEQDQIGPLRKAIADAQLPSANAGITGSDGHIEPERPELAGFDPA